MSKNKNLIVIGTSIIYVNFSCYSEIIERLNLTYTLHIKDETRSNVHSLNFIGTTSILDVKSAVYSITNIPVRHQVWSGWPENLKEDSTLLGYAGIDHPVHYLYLRSSESEEKKKQHKRVSIIGSLHPKVRNPKTDV